MKELSVGKFPEGKCLGGGGLSGGDMSDRKYYLRPTVTIEYPILVPLFFTFGVLSKIK